MNKFIAFSFLPLSILLFACNNSKTVTGAPNGGSELLYQSIWKLTEVQSSAVPAETKANLALTPGEVNKATGNTGCNRMNGTFVLSSDHNIKFSPLATTRMTCVDENLSSIEKKYLDALTQTNKWSIIGDELQLLNSEIIVAKFKGQKAPNAEQAKLNGTWELNYISGPRIAFDGLFPNKKPTIIFSLPEEQVSGNGSCNGYSSVIKLDGNNITFKDPLSTMMACE